MRLLRSKICNNSKRFKLLNVCDKRKAKSVRSIDALFFADMLVLNFNCERGSSKIGKYI